MLRKLKLLTITSFLVLGMSRVFLATPVPALATTTTPPPAFTSATYNVGTGVLTITGTNLVATTGANNDINLAKVNITDGKENSYTLTSKGEILSATEATITLDATDEAALTKFLDQNGTGSLNQGNYQINCYSGWDGTTSTTDVSHHVLTVSGVVGLTSATYDLSSGNLVITGTSMVAATSPSAKDITAKYLTITDGATHSYTLTTSTVVKLTSATSATIPLNAVDKLAVQAIFNQSGTASIAGSIYNLTAAYGWNGTAGIASMHACGITVSNYSAPAITVAAGSTVVCGRPITSVTTSKAGTVYVVPTSAFSGSATGSVNLTDAVVATATTAKNNENLAFKVDGTVYTYTIASGVTTQAGFLTALNGVLTTHATATVNASGYLVVTSTSTGAASTVAVDASSDASTVTAFLGTPTIAGVPTTQAALDSLVIGGTALKATVTDPTKTISIATTTSKTNPFKLTTKNGTFQAIAADEAGVLSPVSINTITMTNINAPVLTATVAIGTTAGTRVTAIVTAGSGDTLAYEFSNSSLATPIPIVGTIETLATGSPAVANSIYAYTSGNDIFGVDSSTNKYLAIYELNSSKAVVKFYAVTLTAAKINVSAVNITAIGAVSGTAQVGVQLTAGALTPAGTVSYQWKSSATSGGTYTAITGATAATYTPVAGDVGNYLEVVATGTGSYSGTVTSVPTAAVVAATPITAIGAISGTAQVGVQLTAGALTPAGTASYQWMSSATSGGTYTAITGATAVTYTPVAGDVGNYLEVVATGTGSYSGTVTSVPTAAVGA